MEKILVIEDEALVARELKGRLTNMGWDVVGVAYGAEGVELARQTKPDLLLSDIHLKDGLSGIDLALEIQRENDLPVIFLTAYSDEDTVNKAKEASPFGYIIKPVETRELQINIEMALYKFRIEKELKETQQLLETALTCIGSALIFVGESGVITDMNQDAVTLFGRDGVGETWNSVLHLESPTSISNSVEEALARQQVTRLAPFVINRPQRHMLLLDGIIGPLDKGGVLILRELAEIDDAVEVLPSTQEILATLGPEALTPSESALCQMLLSVEGSATPKLMAQLAQHLDSSLRATDVLSVFADSLISVSMPYTSIAEANQIAESLRHELSHILFDGRTLDLSIGLAHSTAGDQQPLELFRRAAEALDRARETGGIKIWEDGRTQGRSSEIPTERDYYQLILLWNVMNVVSRSGDIESMGQSVCRHMLQTLGLQVVAMITRQQQSIATLAGVSADQGDLTSIAELGLSESEFHLVETFFGDYAGDAQYQQTYLFHISHDVVLFLRANQEIAAREVDFLRTLVGYFASGVARLSPLETLDAELPIEERTLVHRSPQMASILESAKLVAPTDATVLVVGESGTGKELLARNIHDLSPRKDKPFIIVDCGAVVDNLIESELFGHERGAFTGADRKFSGRLKEAEGGTVLLDEIGELPLTVQVKLLRFVQDREVAAVGSASYEHVDTRVIAATNRDLKSMVDRGLFREDLYYRLNVFTIESPSLRERPDDVLLLARHYLALYAAQYGKGTMEFTPDAEQALMQHAWPGNVRELMNLVNRSVIVSKENRVNNIHLGLFPDTQQEAVIPTTDRGLAEQVEVLVDLSLQQRPAIPPIGQWLEDDLICNQLETHGGVLSQVATNLGVPESTLRRKVSKIKEVYGDTAPNRLKSWIDSTLMFSELTRLSLDRNVAVLDLAQQVLVTEIERRKLPRQEAAKLLGVSIPTYRRYLIDP